MGRRYLSIEVWEDGSRTHLADVSIDAKLAKFLLEIPSDKLSIKLFKVLVDILKSQVKAKGLFGRHGKQ